ncbi:MULTISPECIES: hypothetical protein [Aequorivita]|uniref:Peptidase M23 n=2 Tax=Aequorivita TaxID=153265 RepID=A0AB35YUI4_9FLAO|nr:hypothetical protein [Aequorivita sp. Ant34-E75]WGF92476.1 hypothetical protein QCQ61_14870 [Aequorivita sp. Ant34-E75]
MKKKKNISNFKVPEEYFETFEERLFSRISKEKFPKTSGFKAPKEYFENFDDRILAAVTTSERPIKHIQLIPKKYFGYAAAIAACLLIAFTVFTNTNSPANLDALQLAAIDAYIAEGNLNLDLYDLTTYIEDNDITDIDFETEQFSEGALEEYLLNNLDAATIINEP